MLTRSFVLLSALLAPAACDSDPQPTTTDASTGVVETGPVDPGTGTGAETGGPSACTLAAGTPWGSCSSEVACTSPDGAPDFGTCHKISTGYGTCMPPCSDASCPEAQCLPGPLRCTLIDGVDLKCLPDCAVDADCPLAVMECTDLGCAYRVP